MFFLIWICVFHYFQTLLEVKFTCQIWVEWFQETSDQITLELFASFFSDSVSSSCVIGDPTMIKDKNIPTISVMNYTL